MSRRSPIDKPITIELDGEQLQAKEGEPVACSLIAHGELLFARSPKYHRPRGPFCLSGGCSQCLMRVDGVPNVPTCRVPAKPGMRLERQNALPDARVDLLRAADFVFRSWFNHHEFLAGVPVAETVLQKVARKLSGLGVLPDKPAPERAPAVHEEQRVVIVGAGAAGLAAAKRLSDRGVPYVLFERDAAVGGRLINAAETGQPPVWQPPAERLRTHANVVGLFADDGRPFLAVIVRDAGGARLHLVFYGELILAVGGQPMLPTFPNNDLPGVMAARAVSMSLRRYGILPGQKVACVGEAGEARALAQLVTEAGGTAVAVGAEVVRTHGLRQVEAVTVREAGGEKKIDCDIVALCGAPSPSTELARAGGARVAWDARARHFVVETDAQGRTASKSLFVAGEQRGPMSSATAAEQGFAAANLVGGAS